MATSTRMTEAIRAGRPQPARQAAPASAPPRLPLPCLAPAALTGVLLWACFHPLSWGWLAWGALVPLLCLVRSTARPRNIYWSAYLGGSLFFWAALQWMRVADYRMYATWAMLAVYCALYFPLAVYFVRLCERRTPLPLCVSLPAVWLALEYFRTWFATGFSWYLLGHTQHDALPVIQVADLGGVFAVSLLVLAVNAAAFEVLYQFAAVRTFLSLREPPTDPYAHGWGDWWRKPLVYEVAGVAALVVGALTYGHHRLAEGAQTAGPTVALLQGNLDQRIRNAAAQNAADPKKTITQHYDELTRLALRFHPPAELLVWPETSLPLAWTEADPSIPIQQIPEKWLALEGLTRRAFADIGIATKTNHLLGTNTFVLDPSGKERPYNSALFLTPGGSVVAKYDKMHRVPFGEYVPFRDWLPFMDWFSPYDWDYSIRPGEKFTRFELGEYRFGVLVCYEDADMYLARHYAVEEPDGPPVDFFINMSNDGWFDGSSEHEEHLAVSRFRAVECRRSMVRSVNMGISAVIDSNGRVLRPTLANTEDFQQNPKSLPLWAVPRGEHKELPHAEWGKYKKAAGVLAVEAVPIDRRVSYYGLYGDWLPVGCWVMILGVCAWAVVRREKPAAVAA